METASKSKRPRAKRPLTEKDPIVCKTISLRSSIVTKLQNIADKEQGAEPGMGNVSLVVRKSLNETLGV